MASRDRQVPYRKFRLFNSAECLTTYLTCLSFYHNNWPNKFLNVPQIISPGEMMRMLGDDVIVVCLSQPIHVKLHRDGPMVFPADNVIVVCLSHPIPVKLHWDGRMVCPGHPPHWWCYCCLFVPSPSNSAETAAWYSPLTMLLLFVCPIPSPSNSTETATWYSLLTMLLFFVCPIPSDATGLVLWGFVDLTPV